VMIPLDGELPSPMAPPSGCVFRTRCFRAEARCAAEVPALIDGVACHFPGLMQKAG
jgi:oligopeptide transport system ATP-binding protein